MYKIHLPREINQYEVEELIKVFLKAGDYSLVNEQDHCDEPCESDANEADCGPQQPDDIHIYVPLRGDSTYTEDKREKDFKNEVKRFLFQELQRYTGEIPDWGILTGVRPVKLAGELMQREASADKTKKILISDYYLTEEKTRLLMDIVGCQKKIIKAVPREAVGLYIGIPFCPTRCVYCSFPSNQGKEAEIQAYFNALQQEISFVAENMNALSWYPETVYIGGGTPTTLSAVQLEALLKQVTSEFDLRYLNEFTVEAGRPDTITNEKLAVIHKYNVDRISINPQSMKQETLDLIGRAHKPEEIVKAFQMARAVGIPAINTDVIAGLPEETEADFAETLERILELAPENITVHTLALKRASRLKEIDSEFNYKQGKRVRAMLNTAKDQLNRAGYHPYYLYRQKQMTGNFENVGYAKGNTEGIYNIRIMEEAQTIIALGAGGISKAYYPAENRLERIPNVSNYQIYIERLDEMLQRKSDHLFNNEEEKEC